MLTPTLPQREPRFFGGNADIIFDTYYENVCGGQHVRLGMMGLGVGKALFAFLPL